MLAQDKYIVSPHSLLSPYLRQKEQDRRNKYLIDIVYMCVAKPRKLCTAAII